MTINRTILKILPFVFLGFLLAQDVDVANYDCEDCHGEEGWEILEFEFFSHNETRFPLQGNHSLLECNNCHPGNTIQDQHNFDLVDPGCNSCHLDIHESLLGDDCSSCHQASSWQVTNTSFNHESTNFPLIGAHRQVLCNECHREVPMIQFSYLSTDCYSCHEQNYINTDNPNHAKAHFNFECTDCHTTSSPSWLPAKFNHQSYTGYPLSGSHSIVSCNQCHQAEYNGTSQDCATCHLEDFEMTGGVRYPNAPAHTQNTFYTQNCEDCHFTTTWSDASIDHNLTDFALTGQHNVVACNECHAINNYDLPQNCEECHIPNGIAQTNNTNSSFNHDSHNLPDDCTLCHDTQSWTDQLFSHNLFSSSDCIQCHQVEHDQASEPQHTGDNIGINCSLCHITDAWQIDNFAHSALQTNYELTGAHKSVDCSNCHVSYYSGTSQDCWSCHQKDYNSTGIQNFDHIGHQLPEDCSLCHETTSWNDLTFSHQNFTGQACGQCHSPEHENALNPVHSANNIGNNCTLCHNSNAWTISDFEHNELQTGYSLEGLHLVSTCENCHINGIYNGTPNTCQNNACHLNDYQATSAPNHPNMGLPTIYCEDCHNPLGWIPSLFSHNLNIDCVDCHLTNYNNAKNPPHSNSSGFSKNCNDCHKSVTTWNGATFNHSGISSGCASCHIKEYNNTSNPNHSSVGYGTNCQACHNSTKDWHNAQFSHPFPIYSGAHKPETWGNNCNVCHTNSSKYSDFSCGLNGACHKHDESKMNEKHDDENGYTYNSQACYGCHPDGKEPDDNFIEPSDDLPARIKDRHIR
ncbi:hypothetical protein ACFL46_00980 [Candidatus Neomarinimicrobiota bacterium]